MYLKKGDTIGLISPARAIERSQVDPAIAFFEKQGLQVKLGEHIFDVEHQMAGTDENKAKDIQRFIDDKSIKAIVSTRGGYGCVRVIDRLNLEPLAIQKKWFVGYSDVTVFHSDIHSNHHTPTLHATMPINISSTPSPEEAIGNDTLIKALFGEDLIYDLNPHPLNKTGNASGKIIGGNLSMLYSLCGSVSDIDTRGKILFIEDLDEYLYHVDRMIMNLKRTGKLNQLSALVVGSMSDMKDNTNPFGKNAEEIILDHTQEYNYPIYFGFKAGHDKPNCALRLGMKALIKDNQLLLPA